MASLVAVAIFHEPSEAAVAFSCLDAHGLVAVLPEWHHGSMAWHHVYALHGLRLWTLDVMAGEARDLLGTAGRPAPTAAPGARLVRSDVSVIELVIAAAAFLLAGLPFPVWKRRWRSG